MQNPDRFTQGWYAVIGKRIVGGFSLRWLLPTAILILALGPGFTTSPIAVQAQDGGSPSGQRVSADFSLQVDPRGLIQNRLCKGRTVSVPVTVSLQSYQAAGGEVGNVTVRGLEISATGYDSSIVSVAPSRSWSPDTSRPQFQSRVDLTGEEVGRTTVSITVTVQSDIGLWLDDEVALPIPHTARTQTAEVPVQVVPCEFRVDIGSIWVTSMHGAGNTLLIANAHNIRLTSVTGVTFAFDPPPVGTPFLEWTWANNRIRGCWASSGTFFTQAPAIRAEIRDDQLAVTINYARAVPGDGNSQYYRNLCLPHFSGEPCSEHPDGICFVMPVNRPFDWFEPQRLEPPDLLFPLNGATLSPTHRINHSWGSANGRIHITVVPVH
jgi:hypothetical protein